jgi:hypothetical protein
MSADATRQRLGPLRVAIVDDEPLARGAPIGQLGSGVGNVMA